MNVVCITTDLAAKTYWRRSRLKTRAGFEENRALCLYPQIREQICIGFGGAFTEAAAATWLSLPKREQNALIEACFGEKGLRYVLGRTHMNSCDFSLGSCACLSEPGEAFDFSRDEKYRLPMLLAADQASGGKLQLMLSPWSPPAFMKTNGSMTGGGRLKEEYRSLWAACMAEYVRKHREAGLDVRYISVQNEPDAVQTWESCLYSAEEEADFAANALDPALKAAGAADTQILIWDHNKDQLLERMQRSCADKQQAKHIAGAAFHWYSGDHFEAVALCRRLYPDKTLLFSEGCVEYSHYRSMSDVQNAERYAHDMIGNLNAGTNGSLD